MNILELSGTVVTDGAWGTQMQARGLPLGEIPDGWNLTHAELVQEVAQAYCDAGSQIILTNTFQANRIALESHGLAEKAYEINRRGAEISVRAAQGQTGVLGSIGPTGKLLLEGKVTEQDLLDAFTQQAAALASGGVDGLVIETMSDLVEAKLALLAAKQTGLPVVACMVFDSGSELDRTMMGVSVENAARSLTAAGADVIGANCGQGVQSYLGVCQTLRGATHLPLWIKANAGIPQIVDGKAVYETTPDEFADGVEALIEAGATYVGGCCGTSPEYIRALVARLG